MERRIVDGEITLVLYDPNYKASLPWYQDAMCASRSTTATVCTT